MASATYRGRMIVNDTDYTGSFVDPNPSGVATDDLNTVAIDGKIFNVVGSGGGSSGGSAYREAVLWSGNSSTSTWASPVTMSLNDNVTNYDEILVQFCDGVAGYAFVSIPTSDIPSNYAEKYFTNGSFVYTQNVSEAKTGYIIVTASNEILGYTATGTTITYTKVIGRKFGGNLSPIIYSTEEREVGVWKNNKPLYQKTCVFGSVSGQTASLSLGIANIEEAFLCADASYINDGVCPLPYVIGTAYTNNIGGFFDIGVNDTSFAIRIGQSMAGNVDSVVLTVRYTKTTDVAGSGRYNTLGVPNVHYDGNEKVIGTWFGETLYERTLNVGSLSSANDAFVIGDKSVLKIKNCVEMYGKCTYISNGEQQTIALPNYNNTGYYVRIYYISDLGYMLGTSSLNGKTGIWFEFTNDAFQYYNQDIYITIKYTKTT